jgi:hypothetical protein
MAVNSCQFIYVRNAPRPRHPQPLFPGEGLQLVARPIGDDNRVAMAPWSEVVAVAGNTGFELKNDALDLDYFATPTPILNWIADLPLADMSALSRLHPFKVFETELLASARHATRFGKPWTPPNP